MHSDILKNILVNCSNLSFNRYYSCVRSHQEDKEDYKNLLRQLQLNSLMNFLAKQTLWELQPTLLPTQKAFPLKPVCIFAGDINITADMSNQLWFWVHWQLAQKSFHQMSILFAQEFDLVD
jgi:hypothetical protein